jgi:hypothetical protein
MMNIKFLAVAHVLVKLPTKGRSLMYKMIYVIKILLMNIGELRIYKFKAMRIIMSVFYKQVDCLLHLLSLNSFKGVRQNRGRIKISK